MSYKESMINNKQIVPAFAQMQKWMLLCLLFFCIGCNRRDLTYYASSVSYPSLPRNAILLKSVKERLKRITL